MNNNWIKAISKIYYPLWGDYFTLERTYGFMVRYDVWEHIRSPIVMLQEYGNDRFS